MNLQKVKAEIKAALKRVRWLYQFNAVLRAAWLKRRNAWLDATYQARAQSNGISHDDSKVVASVRTGLLQRGADIVPKSKGRFTFIWVGANRDQDFGGFLQSLERFGSVHCLEREDGSYGQEFPEGGKSDPAVSRRNGERVLKLVERLQSKGQQVDLVWGQMWANYIDVQALERIRDLGVPTVNVTMDDRLPELWIPQGRHPVGSIGLGPGIDLFLTSSPECLIRYAVHGYPAIFWPMASDPDTFRPAAIKDIPVSFVGNKYGVREKLMNFLARNGIKVEAFGAGWPNGPVHAEAAADIFSRSRIILGVGTIGHTTDVYTLKLRDFDATMAGALYVTHRNPDLLQLFEEEKELECYATFDEAALKISYYRDHPEKAQVIGAAAASKARRLHTWDGRISEVLSLLGLIEVNGNQAQRP